MTDHELIAWVNGACTDYDGSTMPDAAEPIGVTCGDLRRLAAALASRSPIPGEEDDTLAGPVAERVARARVIAEADYAITYPSRAAAQDIRNVIRVLLQVIDGRQSIPGELKAMARAIYETRSRVRHPGDPHTTWATWEQCCDLPGWLDWQLAIAQACWDASPGPSALNHLKAVHEWDQSYGRALPDRLAAQIGQTLREALRQTPHQGGAT